MVQMVFIKFKESARSFSPKVSLSPTGVLNFNFGALKRLNLDNFKICVLYYDQDENKIGIECSNDETAEGALKLRKRQTGADLGARRFLDFFNIRPTTLTLYDVEEGDKPDFYVIHLQQGKERILGKHKKKEQSQES